MAEERLSAAQRSRIRRLATPKELAPDEEGGELNIIPFLDIITNVLMFVLASVSVTFTATIDTFPPKAGGRAPTTPTLGLTVILVPEGFSVKARGGNVSTGCADLGPGIAIPKRKGTAGDFEEEDFNQLRACVYRLKSQNPDFADENGATVSANPNVPLRHIIATMDAIRKIDTDLVAECKADDKRCKCAPDEKTKAWEGPGCLFPDITFGLAR